MQQAKVKFDAFCIISTHTCVYRTHFAFFRSILFVGFEKIVRVLIEKGAKVNAVNKKGNSALIFAALSGKSKSNGKRISGWVSAYEECIFIL